ncbi:MAG TPA: DNA-3-methyladenine glycosylase 2 [Gemmatimonadales bacterium]|nr:DNA-3-methyladenine glycosylase 2 [Gemmatimonadales bacterium]
MSDDTMFYNAYASRDPRFDGVFFIGVTSTGIYCRPVCPARTPKPANCRFFASAEAAEKARFRPCLRCRPELAPGQAPVDGAQRIAGLIVQRIDEGMLDGGAGLERIAQQFGWSSRQIRRILQQELGVSPIELLQTRRLLLAKQLLTETRLPVTEIAFASGFASLRRFNDAFGRRYGMPPSHLRKAATGSAAPEAAAPITLQLSYRPPFDWAGLLAFLRARALKGVERVDGDAYLRTVRLGTHDGWVRVRHAPRQRALVVEFPHALTPALPVLLGRLRHLFDLNARPDVIAAQLSSDAALSKLVKRRPGLRVPGAFDGFELAVRAVLGQQVSVKAATTIAGRLVQAFGEPIETPHEGLTHLAPAPERLALASLEAIASLGIVRTRAQSIIALARAVQSGNLALDAGAAPEVTVSELQALPGIGAWTAHYVAMRALRWPDAFPREDLVVRKRLGDVTAVRAEAMAEAWRPWRSYATLYLWGAES